MLNLFSSLFIRAHPEICGWKEGYNQVVQNTGILIYFCFYKIHLSIFSISVSVAKWSKLVYFVLSIAFNVQWNKIDISKKESRRTTERALDIAVCFSCRVSPSRRPVSFCLFSFSRSRSLFWGLLRLSHRIIKYAATFEFKVVPVWWQALQMPRCICILYKRHYFSTSSAAAIRGLMME